MTEPANAQERTPLAGGYKIGEDRGPFLDVVRIPEVMGSDHAPVLMELR